MHFLFLLTLTTQVKKGRLTMKKMHILLLGALPILLLFVTCAQDTPVSPVLNNGNQVTLAKASPQVFTFSIDPFLFVNPCTGQLETVSGTETQTVHFFLTINPVTGAIMKHHLNIHSQTDITTTAGFSGSQIFKVVDNGTGPPGSLGEFFAQTVNLNVDLSNAAGQREKIRFFSHLTATIVSLNPVVLDVKSSHDSFSATCVGKPQ